MRIQGHINYGYKPPAPFIVSTVTLHQLNVEGKIPFIIDTGASNTMILWSDVERLEIDSSKIVVERTFTGLGGIIGAKPETATITFKTDEGEYIEEKVITYIATISKFKYGVKHFPT